MKRILSIVLSMLLVATTFSQYVTKASAETLPNDGNAEDVRYVMDLHEVDEYESGKIKLEVEDETNSEEEVKHSPDEIVRATVLLSSPSTLDKGYSTVGVAYNSKAVSYRQSLKKSQDNLTSKMANKLGHSIDVVWNLTLAMNAISINIPYGEIETIRQMSGVKGVELEKRYEPMVDSPNTAVTTKEMVFASMAWANGFTGAGSKVAIIDTGTNQDHISFQGDALEYSLTKDGKSLSDYDLLTTEKISEVLSQLNAKSRSTGATAAQFRKSTKIPYAYNYVDRNFTTDHDSDGEGEHGSHVSGIAAANRYVKQNGEFVDAAVAVGAVGVAPDAQIITMKVFGAAGGAFDSDYMVAIEDAIVLGADSANLSLGSGSSGWTFGSTYEAVMNKLVENNTAVVMSAGNNGAFNDVPYSSTFPYPGYLYYGDVQWHTGGSPGSFKNSLTVASADNIGSIGAPLTFNGSRSVFYSETDYSNAKMTTIAGSYDYVYIDAAGETSDYQTVNAVIPLAGKVVMCNRGSISFYVKADNCAQFNPKAVVICNNQEGVINMDLTDMTSTFPCVSILQKDAQAIKEESTSQIVGGISVYTGTVKVETGLSYGLNETIENAVISSYSSTGTTGALILKPEITAPGGSIWSVNGMTDDGFELMSGTSMAAPHVTGMAAIVGQYLESVGLDDEKRHNANSLLMATAVPMKKNGQYYSLLQQGAGLGNVGAAVSSKSLIKMDANATATYKDGKVKVELGDDPSRTGKYVYSFYITNYSDTDIVYQFSTDMFTQAVYDTDEGRFVGLETERLAASVSYNYEMPAAFSADVNKDGFTDEADAQAILDYLTGKVAGSELDLTVADIDSNGKVSSYDARQLLKKLNENAEIEGLLVPAGATKKVDVKIQLNNVEQLSALYDKGNFVEGFTFVKCASQTGEGEILDVEKSIPILGYFGSWTDASMYDSASPVDALYSEVPKVSYIGVSSNYMNITYPGDVSATTFVGNPYIVEAKFPEERLAISSDTVVSTIAYAPLRKMAATAPAALKLDADGNAVSVAWTGSLATNVENPYYNANSATPSWQARNTRSSTVNKAVSSFGVNEGDKVWIGQFSLPEYYGYKLSNGTSGSLSSSQFNSVLLSGNVGEGAVLGYKFTVDDTAPVIDSVELSVDKKSLTVKVHDNQYIAMLAVLDAGASEEFAKFVPEQSAPGQQVSYTLDCSNMDVNAVTVMVADYAGNENVQLAVLGDGPIVVNRKYYVLTNTVAAGKKYIVCNSNTASSSSRHAMNANGNGVSDVAVNVVTDTSLSTSPIIKGDDLSSKAVVWEAVASGNTDYPVMLKSVSGTYLRRTSSSRNSSTIQLVAESAVDSSCYWGYPSGNRVRNGGSGNNYLYYYSTRGLWVTYTSSTASYLYEEREYSETIDPSVATSVEVVPNTKTLYGGGETVQLTATVNPVYLSDKSVTWSSSDETVATVDENGLVTSLNNDGTVTITATSVATPTVQGTATITVVANNPYNGYTYGIFNTEEGPTIGAVNFSDSSLIRVYDAASAAKGGGLSGSQLWVWDEDDALGYYDLASENNPDEFNALFAINTLMAPYDAANLVDLVAHDEAGNEYHNDPTFKFLAMAPYSSSGSATGCYLFMYTEDGSLSGWNLGGSNYKFDAITFAGKGADENGNTTAYYYALRCSNSSSTNNHLYLLSISGEIGANEETGEMEFQDSLGLTDLGAVSGLPFAARSNMSANYSMSYFYSDSITDKEVLFVADNSTSLMYAIEVPVTENGFGTPTAQYLCKVPGATGAAALFNLTFDTVASRPALPTSHMQSFGTASVLDLNKKTEEVEEPVVEAPVVEEPVVEEPVVETPAVEEPVVEEPVTEGTLNYVRDFAPEANKSNPINRVILNNASVEVPQVQGDVKSVEYYEDIAVGNGFVQVDYDPSVTSFVGVVSPFEYTSVEDDGNGTVKFSYAQLEELPVDETTGKVLVATFNFKASCENASEIGITVKERNENEEVGEVRNAIIPATGHDYKFVEFEWTETPGAYTAKAVYVCENNSEHVAKYDATVTSERTEPTCENGGSIVYTATYDGHTDTKTELLDELGHDYQFSHFEWTETPGAYTAKAVYVCENNSEHVVKYDATVTCEKTEPTCENGGSYIYTAEYDDHTEMKVEILGELGHNYQFSHFEWTETPGAYTAKAVYVCANDQSHVMKYDATVTPARTEPTCENGGSIVYTATYDGHTDTKTELLDELGHHYEFSHFYWTYTPGAYTAKAIYVCSNDQTHVQEFDATITTERKEPACETDGSILYTATYGTYSDTSLEVIPMINHEYQFKEFEWTELGDDYTAKAVYVCTHDESHVLKFDATVVARDEVLPTCEEKGTRSFTASYSNAEFDEVEHTDVKYMDVEPIGHNYKFDRFEWAEDNSSAEAVFVCGNDESHEYRVEAEVNVETIKPSKERDGKKIFTATVELEDGTVYTDTREVVIPYSPDTGVGVNLMSLFTAMSVSLCGLFAAILRRKDEE